MAWDYDLGVHLWDLYPTNYVGALYVRAAYQVADQADTRQKYAWVAQVLFIHSTCATKVSVLLFYRRMAQNTYKRVWIWTVYVLLFITVSAWIAVFITYCFMCSPLSTYW